MIPRGISGGWWLKAVLAAALVAYAAGQGQGGSGGNTPSCATKLVPCVNYINGTTKPPESCCTPLKEAVTNEKDCLCNIYGDPSLLKAFKINITQAMDLPKLCHIDTGKSGNICQGISPSSSTKGSTSSNPGSGNGAWKISEFEVVSSLLTFATYLLFC